MTLIDRIVTVTRDVAPGELGQVTVASSDGFHEHYAKALTETRITVGTPVRVTAEDHGILTVEPLH